MERSSLKGIVHPGMKNLLFVCLRLWITDDNVARDVQFLALTSMYIARSHSFLSLLIFLSVIHYFFSNCHVIVEHLENEYRNAVRKRAEICALTCDDNSSASTISGTSALIFLYMTVFMCILIRKGKQIFMLPTNFHYSVT